MKNKIKFYKDDMNIFFDSLNPNKLSKEISNYIDREMNLMLVKDNFVIEINRKTNFLKIIKK